jgi:cellobiose phosphorylase
LEIAPVIPQEWTGFSAKRIFRGVTFDITVERNGPGNDVRLIVDGRPISGTIVPLPEESSTVNVHVTLT